MTPKQIYEMPVKYEYPLSAYPLGMFVPEIELLKYDNNVAQARIATKEHDWQRNAPFFIISIWFDDKPFMLIINLATYYHVFITDKDTYYNMVRFIWSIVTFDESNHDNNVIPDNFDLSKEVAGLV